jgi:hypothetical protein
VNEKKRLRKDLRKMDIDVIEKIIKKTIGYELLGLDTNGQWYDSIKNGGKKITTPKFFNK